MTKQRNILLGHGSGGKLSHDLIENIFIKHFNNPTLNELSDSAVLDFPSANLAFTTDSYVVDPIFFPGGNIGKLAICGTINDLAVSGAEPLYLSVGCIIEEGFPMEDLETIVKTMAEEARNAGVAIVTGDTKVVNKGKCDKIFINTAGVGALKPEHKKISTGENIKPGDHIIINGDIADHGIAIISARENIAFESDIRSDACSLNNLIKEVQKASNGIRFMRDATRGGLATVLVELALKQNIGIDLFEENIPIKESVNGLCEIFGYDPLYIANEGKVVMIVAKEETEKVLSVLQKHPSGTHSKVIGNITDEHPKKVINHTAIGGKRIVDMLAGEQLPRIC